MIEYIVIRCREEFNRELEYINVAIKKRLSELMKRLVKVPLKRILKSCRKILEYFPLLFPLAMFVLCTGICALFAWIGQKVFPMDKQAARKLENVLNALFMLGILVTVIYLVYIMKTTML
ncbi:MAG: hypothetical protein Q4B85_12560 [Lachnospiraceae bacterium]|nr:hypothetical protein [Lachnospiraceae bacterium]